MLFKKQLKRDLPKIINKVIGRYTYRTQQMINQYGGKIIRKITVVREPIQSIIDKLLNILSLTKWDDVKNKLSYDDVFHLYIIIEFTDETTIKLEKNQDITIKLFNYSSINGESRDVPLKNNSLFLNQLLINTERFMGSNNYYNYDAFTHNCQNFIDSVLTSNKINTPELKKFILQNAEKLLHALPKYSDYFAHLATSTASYVNRFLQHLTKGRVGFKKGGYVIS